MGLQVGRLSLPLTEGVTNAFADFDCADQGDAVSENVCSFLKEHRFIHGIQFNFSATYLLLNLELHPKLIGYVTLTLDAVRLTNTEKEVFDERPETGGFGSVRIQMIGVDRRHQGQGHGKTLLQLATGIARGSSFVPPRFLLADANVKRQAWYEAQGFVPNQAERELITGERANRVISMRLDLQPAENAIPDTLPRASELLSDMAA